MSCCTDWPAADDPKLHDYYARNLLTPGWGGLLTLREALYIQGHLERDPNLRKRWGIPGRGRVPLIAIAERAFPEDPEEARRNMRNQMERQRVHSALSTAKILPRIDTAQKEETPALLSNISGDS